MEVRVLRYFLTIAGEESITKAADVLHVTQPTLSRQLAQLENEVGVKLFVRGTRKISLTNEGVLLRRRAEEIVELVDKTEKELNEHGEVVEGVISIGCGELAAVGFLAECIETFHQKYPNVTFDLYTAAADHVRERIDHGLTDLGILLEPVDLGKYEFVRLPVKERWVVVMCPDDPLAKQEHVTAQDLADLPLIFPRRTQIQSRLAGWFGDAYDHLNILFTSNLNTNSAMMVYHKLGYALTVEAALPFWDKEKITYRPFYPPLCATSMLAWKKQQPFSLATTKFIEHVM